jgi:hypothetical protein
MQASDCSTTGYKKVDLMYRLAVNIKVIFVVMAFSGLLLAGACTLTENGGSEPAIKQQLEKFLKSEYEGVTDVRNEPDVVTFSPDYQMLYNEVPYGAAVYIAADPLMIVGYYKIDSVRACNDLAIASVLFKRLAHTQGSGLPGREIIPDLIERDSAEYILRKKGNSWTVYNPPFPRISKKAAIEYYKGQISSMQDMIKRKDVSIGRKEEYVDLTKSLAIVNRLSD